MSFLTLRGVTKHYRSVTALDAVDLNVPPGGRTAIVGPSGSGKTTMLRIIAGFEAPDSGRVALDGVTLADGSDVVPAYRRGIGLVMQDGGLFPHLSVADNIGFGLERRNPRRTARILELLRMVELDTAMLDRRPDALSGGQQQRVALARALAREPRLMLLDEPFSALDTGLRTSTRKAVANLLSAAGITTILVTHDQAEALSFADQIAVLGNGKLLQVGRPRCVYLRPSSPMVAEFLGDAIILPALLADGYAECALGRLAVADKQRCGPARIMLRPEQISLASAPSTDRASPDGPRGAVTDVDFSGAVCTVSLRLLDASAQQSETLALQQASFDVPPVGTVVDISVAGNAHVFDAAVPDQSAN